MPPHLRDTYNAEKNDLTAEVLKNLDFLGIDYVIPIGGDDTLFAGYYYQQVTADEGQVAFLGSNKSRTMAIAAP